MANPRVKGSSGRGLGHDDAQALEIVAKESFVAGDERAALQERVRADQEVGHRTPGERAAALALKALLVAPLHLAGADRRAQLGLRVEDAGVLERLDQVAAV